MRHQLQDAATHCYALHTATLQHTATHTLQHTATMAHIHADAAPTSGTPTLTGSAGAGVFQAPVDSRKCTILSFSLMYMDLRCQSTIRRRV
mmetsp:Transcript_365/g.691  ORF Transcript_365/g.691 Transcript_365/m.691 type:complete len:91 (+) Transcript_365:199-471(+)